MEMRKAKLSDIALLVENRMAFVQAISVIGEPSTFRAQTEQYFKEHLNDGSLLCYICVDEGRIISTCLLCIYTTIPIPSVVSGKAGLLLNVWTDERYRRQGLAARLISMLIEEARGMGVGKIVLDYTDEGLPLYQSLGFSQCERCMEMRLV